MGMAGNGKVLTAGEDVLIQVLSYFDIRRNKQEGVCTGTRWMGSGELLESVSPIDGQVIGSVVQPTAQDVNEVIEEAQKAFRWWRTQPPPKRGELVRAIADEVRQHKEMLAKLITIEMGKIIEEAKGEVQEWIDMCDFAVGLSRQLYGLTIASERPDHSLQERWHPLGPVAVITAFNFPVAVWSWNAMIALVCGDTIVWKPSSLTPFCAVAVHRILQRVVKRFSLPEGIVCLLAGCSGVVGDEFILDRRLPLVSFTGSVEAGRHVAQLVARRLGRVLLELGGNNAAIVTPSADLDLALRAVTFAAVGTAGQRCTTLRRLIVHESIHELFLERLKKVYEQLRIGNPLVEGIHVGPLAARPFLEAFQAAVQRVPTEGGRLLWGGEVLEGPEYPSGLYVKPAVAEMKALSSLTCEETFAPLLYVFRYREIEEAIELNNGVPQGLSSAIFTTNLWEAELFLSAMGSDCGIANVNTGTSGAEIGGAFGGEKDTGGGREAGSDAWKAYMRRQTVTINWGRQLPLAQGIRFEV